MKLELQAACADAEEGQAAASAAQADKQLLQRQLEVSTASSDKLQATLDTLCALALLPTIYRYEQ